MEHEKFKEWIQLSIYDELSEEENLQLLSHLKNCNECSREFMEMNKLRQMIEKAKPAEIDEKTLLEARQDLRTALRMERNRKTFGEDIIDKVRSFLFLNYKAALGSAFTLVLGLAIGYMVFRPHTAPFTTDQIQPAINQQHQAQNDVKIDNLRFEDSDASDGQVEFSFDAVKPVHMKGNINDEAIQKVLARALVNESNDGMRLRTISTIAAHTGNDSTADPQIKSALITTLKSDNNPGVRREALLVLSRLKMDREIKNALLYTLANDKNAGLRIAAINSLQTESPEKLQKDQELIKVLKQKSQDDQNDYIRIRAKAVLQEVIEQ
ncbi:MAG TPA: HEAT repeat domain-containing protein [Ignavibacteriales bacterium]|nr:HEAT repeat domain-containing protein [Ignavibacteriales bacterium]